MRPFALIFILTLLLPVGLKAGVKLPAIFSNHMVLQGGVEIPLWGWAEPGEQVSASIAGQKLGAIAGKDGKWSLRFGAVRASNEPLSLSVTGKNNAITISDVLVGDVWLASGQSNMELPLKVEKYAAEELPQTQRPTIRFFTVPYLLANDPQADCKGEWEICTPESAAGFSAVAYYFAVDVQKMTNLPVGVIGSYRGGSIVQGWTSIEGFRSQPSLAPFVEEYETTKVKTAPMMVKFEESVKKFEEAERAAKEQGKSLPKKMKRPENRILSYRTPTLMHNGMISPLVPYAIKGVIWYQGESDAHNMMEVNQYRTLFPNMIKDWRRLWGAEFPFLYVQLPNYRKRATEPGESVWAAMREVQTASLQLPKTGMAVTIDLGDVDKPDNIHPLNKRDVAARLSLVAERVAYAKDVIDSGPMFDKMTIEQGKARIHFGHVGAGLVIGMAPGQSPENKLLGFAIAGVDRHFVGANAKIESDGTVLVQSEQITAPIAVRYGWADNPIVNLYNKDGLPASPFRTDDWPLNDPPK